MKVFLSHSSKDKHIVRQVADYLGDMRVELDEYTFDYKLTTSEIRAALKRSDLFVLLLSNNSIASTFVDEEVRATLEIRAGGSIKQVVVIALDDSSHRNVPEWMRELNVAQRLSTPKQLARRIDSFLSQLEVAEGQRLDFYFGRDQEEAELRKQMARPKADSPIAVSVVGNFGIGRRTFLRHALQKASPRYYSYFVPITVDEYDSSSEIYRNLYEVIEVNNPLKAGEDFAIFERLGQSAQTKAIATYIRQIAEDGGMLMIIDEGGVLADSGDLRDVFAKIIEALGEFGRPVISFIQFRMMKFSFKAKYPRICHVRLNALSPDVVGQILGLTLKELDVSFTEGELLELSNHIGGEPINISLVASYVAEEGVDVLLADPSEIIELKAQRGQDYLRRLAFSDTESDILCTIREYRYCDIEFLGVALGAGGVEIVEAVRRLEDFCCIERRDRMLSISPPLRDAVRRDRRFTRDNQWHTASAARVLEVVREYSTEDSIQLSFIDTALPDLLRSGEDIPFVSTFVLPSHLLRVGRDYYDKGNWARAIEFCQLALEASGQLSLEGRIEANRLLGLALTRSNLNDVKIAQVVDRLRGYQTSTASRVAFFIEGFKARRAGDYDIAEGKFLEAARLDRENYHINRELSSVLCRVGRFAEAEPYARSAHARASDNPYILDVLIEALEGKHSLGMSVDREELVQLNNELQLICEAGGFHFHSIREARRVYSSNAMAAFGTFAEVLKNGSSYPEDYYQRARLLVRSGATKEAREDIERLRGMARNLPEAARYADEIEAELLISQRRYADAREHIEGKFSRAVAIRSRLTTSLKRAIGYDPTGVPAWLQDWAKRS